MDSVGLEITDHNWPLLSYTLQWSERIHAQLLTGVPVSNDVSSLEVTNWWQTGTVLVLWQFMFRACFLFSTIIAAILSLERIFWNWYSLIKPHKNNKTTTASQCEAWTALESSFAQVCPHIVPGSPCRIQFSSPNTTAIFSIRLGRTYCHLLWEKIAIHSNYTFVQQHRGALLQKWEKKPYFLCQLPLPPSAPQRQALHFKICVNTKK